MYCLAIASYKDRIAAVLVYILDHRKVSSHMSAYHMYACAVVDLRSSDRRVVCVPEDEDGGWRKDFKLNNKEFCCQLWFVPNFLPVALENMQFHKINWRDWVTCVR